VGHRKNSQNKNEYEMADVLNHVDQHSDVVACGPEDSEEIEEPNPHDDSCKGIKGSHYLRAALIIFISQSNLLRKFSMQDFGSNHQYNQGLVHIVPHIADVR
jgi:hypothetical protein